MNVLAFKIDFNFAYTLAYNDLTALNDDEVTLLNSFESKLVEKGYLFSGIADYEKTETICEVSGLFADCVTVNFIKF